MGKTATARQQSRRRPPRRVLPTRKLSPENQSALRWLDEWMKSPPLEDEAFWREFERDLRQNRMTLRKAR